MVDARRLFPQNTSFRASTSQRKKQTFRKIHEAGSDVDVEWAAAARNWKNRLEKRTKRPKDAQQKLLKAKSPTQQWIYRFPSVPILLPKRLSEFNIPEEVVKEPQERRKHRMVPLDERSEEERQSVEAVLTTPIPILCHYVTHDMMELIKNSPFIQPGEDVLVIHSDRMRTREHNERECYILLSRLLRNVASQIVYKEERMAASADEKPHAREDVSSKESPK